MTLRADLGSSKLDHAIGSPSRKHRSPAYDRRRRRRQESRVVDEAEEASLPDVNLAEKVVEEAEKALETVKTDVKAEKPVVENVKDTGKVLESSMKTIAEEAGLSCESCDFKTIWSNSLKIHIHRIHSQYAVAHSEKNIKEKYDNTRHYWEKGRVGISYAAYVEAFDVIEASNLSQKEKLVEKDRLLERRKDAFGDNYVTYPPWCKR